MNPTTEFARSTYLLMCYDEAEVPRMAVVPPVPAPGVDRPPADPASETLPTGGERMEAEVTQSAATAGGLAPISEEGGPVDGVEAAAASPTSDLADSSPTARTAPKTADEAEVTSGEAAFEMDVEGSPYSGKVEAGPVEVECMEVDSTPAEETAQTAVNVDPTEAPVPAPEPSGANVPTESASASGADWLTEAAQNMEVDTPMQASAAVEPPEETTTVPEVAPAAETEDLAGAPTPASGLPEVDVDAAVSVAESETSLKVTSEDILEACPEGIRRGKFPVGLRGRQSAYG
jgi:hypothetical protein